ncbi:MAG: hypothetical protein WCI01_03820 [Chlorobiaceae bacterium]
MQKERSESILEEIEKRHVVPIPRWHFIVKRFGFWMLALISVLTGAISMATAMYVFLDHDFIEDHGYINQFFIERPIIADIVSSIPYIWLAALVLFTLVAFFGVRHTKKGYRYSAKMVIAASLTASLFISAGLNMVDIGEYIHRYLIENVHVYNNLIYANEQRWTNSDKGLLGGKVIEVNMRNHLLVIKDFSKAVWHVDISKAEVHSKTQLASGKYLKITGIKTGKRTFQALSIQGWEKRYHKRTLPSQKIAPAKRERTITIL